MEFAADAVAAAREPFMRRALELARRSLAAGGPPVGACLVRDGQVLAVAHNAVIQELDVTAHAEIQVLRLALERARALRLPGTDLYVTVEPCTMCLSASFYAGVSQVFFGAPITALRAVTGSELCIPPAQLFADVGAGPAVHGGVLEDACASLVAEWARATGCKPT